MSKRTQTHASPVLPLGQKKTREAVFQMLKKDPSAYDAFCHLHNSSFQEELIQYFMGNSGIQVTYDAIFKHLFHPERHPHRLSQLLSCLIGEPVEVKRTLPSESDRLSETGSLLIMDILVELQSGELANVEMQRIGYYFPGQRAACYSSDLILRQYSDVRKREGKSFSYRQLHPVYTIILIGESSEELLRFPTSYIHRSCQTFDTGLQLELLQKFIFISLDNFLHITQNKPIETELEAWLYFLNSTNVLHMEKIVHSYPWFMEMYKDIAKFRTTPKEMIQMYSDALKIMDYNTVQYMIQDKTKKVQQMEEIIAQQEKVIADNKQMIVKSKEEIIDKEEELAEKDKLILNQQKEIEALKLKLT